jgi:hypothetical protein
VRSTKVARQRAQQYSKAMSTVAKRQRALASDIATYVDGGCARDCAQICIESRKLFLE